MAEAQGEKLMLWALAGAVAAPAVIFFAIWCIVADWLKGN